MERRGYSDPHAPPPRLKSLTRSFNNSRPQFSPRSCQLPLSEPLVTYSAPNIHSALLCYWQSLTALAGAQPQLLRQPCKNLSVLGTWAQHEIHFPERLILFWDKSHANLSCQEIIAVELLAFIAVKYNLTKRAKRQSPSRPKAFDWVGGTFSEPSGEFFLKNRTSGMAVIWWTPTHTMQLNHSLISGSEDLEPRLQLSFGHMLALPLYSKSRLSNRVLPNPQRLGRMKKQFANISAGLGYWRDSGQNQYM